MTHVEALELDRLPDHLIVLGGGYVGLELAQAVRRFGSRVTVIERGPRLAGREDADVGAALLELFHDEGIQVLLGAEVRRVEGRSGAEIRVSVEDAGGERAIEATDFLIAAGRTPNTQDIGLDLAGIELDERGYIKVNERLETTASNVWAVGDCAGSPQFTHVAFDDFRIVRDNLNGGNRSTQNRLVPYVMFTDPELARVGLNESEAKSRGIDYRLVKMPMAAVLRTRTLSEPRGFIKMLLDAASDRILGITVFGAEASELMATVQTAMLGQLPFTVLRDAIFTHPTAAEGLTVLLADVATKATQSSRPDERKEVRMNQRVLITAGASGIGREIARAFAANGAKVFVCDIDAKGLDEFEAGDSRVLKRSVTCPNEKTSSRWWLRELTRWAGLTCW